MKWLCLSTYPGSLQCTKLSAHSRAVNEPSRISQCLEKGRRPPVWTFLVLLEPSRGLLRPSRAFSGLLGAFSGPSRAFWGLLGPYLAFTKPEKAQESPRRLGEGPRGIVKLSKDSLKALVLSHPQQQQALRLLENSF